jgi:hypothetical protein
MRDRFLLLAADTAMSAGQPDEAERLRLRLLEHSPHHMLRPFASFAEALGSPDVQGYISDLRQTYPPETAGQLLESLHTNGESDTIPPPIPPPAAATEPTRSVPARSSEPLKVYRVKDEDTEPPPRADVPAAPMGRPLPARKEVVPPIAPKAGRPAAPAAAPPPGFPLPAATPRPLPEQAPLRSPLPLQREAPRPFPGPFVPPPPPRTEQEETTEATGGWVALGLFVVVLLAGVALAVYTFARPFLPAQWLP